MGQATRGGLECAARQLGLTSSILPQRGRRDHVSTAARLGIQPRAVRERGIEPGKVGALLAARPGWLITERQQAQIAREADDSCAASWQTPW